MPLWQGRKWCVWSDYRYAKDAIINQNNPYPKTVDAAFTGGEEKEPFNTYRIKRLKSYLNQIISTQLLNIAQKTKHPTSRLSLLATHLRNARIGMRNGCENAFRDPRSQKSDGNSESVCAFLYGI